MIKAVVFLGNPGIKYKKTRHNSAWMICDHLSYINQSSWKEKFSSFFQTVNIASVQRVFLKPAGFMNNSGLSVRSCMDFFKFQPNEMLVVHDDLETAYGTVALKTGGGLAGHNGLKSIKQHVGSDAFIHLKIGISRPKKIPVQNYVLQPFTNEEEEFFPHLITECTGIINSCLKNDKGIPDKKTEVFQW